MQDEEKPPLGERWAHLRFSVIGPLLASPPRPSELKQTLRDLAACAWLHPATAKPTRFAVSTIERWYYLARRAKLDPVGVLRKRTRSDRGEFPSLSNRLRELLRAQHSEHPSWSYQLHFDNLVVLAQADATLGKMPSYPSVRRFMKAQGLLRRRRVKRHGPPGERPVELPLEPREVRSYEADHVNALWHADFHHGSLPVLLSSGEWVRPIALGILDDRSRLACHVQWYLSETAETFVHGLAQAFQKRALPRALLTDNGSAMLAAETEQGLRRLGVLHDTTLPYSPHQNGKQESFWGPLEGRLMAMLEGSRELTLDLLNRATQAWCELEYNNRLHTELAATPLERYLAGPDLGRSSPPSDDLRLAFTMQQTRAQRRSDGTITLAAQRFEVPARFHHLPRITVRFARWDLAHVSLVDPVANQVLDRLYPLDRSRNADGRRRRRTVPDPSNASAPTTGASDIAPLLKKLLADYAATGLPPSYLPLDESDPPKEDPS